MKALILLVYPALWLGAVFFRARIAKHDEGSSSFLLQDQTRMIQAFACIGVVLHHLTQQITSYGVFNKGPVTVLNDMGFLFTALFFFFSGYGLITSLQTKPDYLKTFLYRRLPSVLIPFWTVNVLGVILNTASVDGTACYAFEAPYAMSKAAVIHPTGTGKSFIGFQYAADHPGTKVIWLAPSE